MNTIAKIFLFTMLSIAFTVPVFAADLHLAVAANFTAPMEQLKPLFAKASGHKLIISYGTVGKFYAQIKNGAPFELLISADDETPIRLEKDGLALPETRFTYVIGKLMFWSTKPGVYESLQSKFVFGENISQTYQFVATANADLGFVALSQIYKNGNYAAGSHWQVPSNLYPQIRQDAVLLTKGRDNPADSALLAFLKTQETKKIIRSYGYDI